MVLEIKVCGTESECNNFYKNQIRNEEAIEEANVRAINYGVENEALKERIDGMEELHQRQIDKIQEHHYEEMAELREEIGRLKNPEAYKEIDKCQK